MKTINLTGKFKIFVIVPFKTKLPTSSTRNLRQKVSQGVLEYYPQSKLSMFEGSTETRHRLLGVFCCLTNEPRLILSLFKLQ